MGKQLIAVLAGIVAVALIAAGCGSSSDKTEVTASSLTKAEFIKKADAICSKGEKQIQGEFVAYATGHKEELEEPTEESFATLADTIIVPGVEQEIEEIRSLGAPKGDEEKVEAILASLEEGIEKADGTPRVMVENTSEVFAKSGKLAKQYGLQVCGFQ